MRSGKYRQLSASNKNMEQIEHRVGGILLFRHLISGRNSRSKICASIEKTTYDRSDYIHDDDVKSLRKMF